MRFVLLITIIPILVLHYMKMEEEPLLSVLKLLLLTSTVMVDCILNFLLEVNHLMRNTSIIMTSHPKNIIEDGGIILI